MKKLMMFLPLGMLALAIGHAQPPKLPTDTTRHVEVLFLGAPTANHPGHDPVERYRVLKKALGVDGIDLTYTEDLADLNPELLGHYDAVMFYGNWKQNEAMDSGQLKALTDFVESGHGFLPIHCASACFGGSDEFIKLVGGRFKSHETGVFKTSIVDKNHPIMRGYEGFETWDETYVHDRLTDDRTVLQLRDKEPWTWVREQGKGKIFYTAYGHDMRCWSQPEFHELLRRAILWSVGGDVRAKLTALKLPTLQSEEMILPGYRSRKTITSGQKPLSPTESMKLAQVPTGFELSLFASDPDLVNPIHVTWDHKGRTYVIETVDYPNNLQKGDLGHDRIHLCEDSNGDGKADKFTVFADKLSIPTSAVFVNGGLICTNGPDMMFFKDSDDDGKADIRKLLFTGFDTSDTHAGVSNLRIGFDDWIYATIGYAGFDGTVGGEKHKFSQGFFRFKPDGSKLEFLQNTTNNTWGLGFNSAFDILGSTANGNPSWYYTFSKESYQAAGVNQPRTPNKDGNPMFFPSSLDIRQVDQFDRYTSAAGHAFYTSTRFPKEYQDKIAFVCEPTGKLAGQFEITENGAGYVSRQLPNNIYNSADAWSGPVCAETGPDGAVWICDWYNLIIQHNPTPNKNSAGYDAKNGKGNAYETPIRDKSMGRIYRIYPKGTTDDVNPKLDPKNLDSLVAALSHPNLFWRIQAQRLLVESGSPIAATKLKDLLKTKLSGHAAVHAIYALKTLGALDETIVRTALASSDRGLFRAGIANATPEILAATAIQSGVIKAPDARLLAETFVALAQSTPSEAIGKALFATLTASAKSILEDPTLSDAWQISARHHAAGVLVAATADSSAIQSSATTNLIPDPGFEANKLGIWSLRPYVEERPGTAVLSVVADGRNGGNALKIVATSRADVGAGARMTVKPNTRYRLAGWVRTENLENKGGQGAMFNVHGSNATKGISGTTGWTELSTEFTTGSQSEILIHCLFGGYGGAVGTAWYDDLSLSEISSADIGSAITSVASHFASAADPAARQAVATAISSNSDQFSKNLVATLGAAPVVVKEVVKKHKPDAAVHERGLAVYTRTCIACHGPDGKGVPGAFPPLDGAEWAVGDASVPIRIVLSGLQGPIEVAGQKYENIMPPHTDLKDQEIADVVTYVRQSWSNDAPAINADLVKATRAKNASRTTPWTAAELK
ncbi:MAG: PVC-type heme-binding CxxCH protein [Verrucomicrobiota bacterium]